MSTLKRIALTLLAVALPCFAWGEVKQVFTDAYTFTNATTTPVLDPTGGWTYGSTVDSNSKTDYFMTGNVAVATGAIIAPNINIGSTDGGFWKITFKTSAAVENVTGISFDVVMFSSSGGAQGGNCTRPVKFTIYTDGGTTGVANSGTISMTGPSSITTATNGAVSITLSEPISINSSITIKAERDSTEENGNLGCYYGLNSFGVIRKKTVTAWSEVEDAGAVVLETTAEGDTLTMDEPSETVSSLTITGAGTLTVSGEAANALTATTTAINASTTVSDATASLGAVTIAADKILTVGTSTTLTSVAGDGKLNGTLQLNANATASIETISSCEAIEVPTGTTLTVSSTTTVENPDDYKDDSDPKTLRLPPVTGEGNIVKTGSGSIVLFNYDLEPSVTVEDGIINLCREPATPITMVANSGTSIRFTAWNTSFDESLNAITLKGDSELVLANGPNQTLAGTITIADAADTSAKIYGSSFNKVTIAANITGTGKLEFAEGRGYNNAGTSYPCDNEVVVSGAISDGNGGTLSVIVSDTANAVTFSGTNTYTGGTTIAEGATLIAPLRSATPMVVNGTLQATYNASSVLTDNDYSQITGTGTIKLISTGFVYLASNASKLFASTLTLENEVEDGIVLSDKTNVHNIGTLKGSGGFRSDMEDTGTATIRVTQYEASESSGVFLHSTSSSKIRTVALTVAGDTTNPSVDKTLTLSGTSTATGALTVESTGSVNLIGTWAGPVVNNGTLGGTGSITGALTLADGATLNATAATADAVLDVTGAVTLPETGTVTINVDGLTAGTTILSYAASTLDVSKIELANAAEGLVLEATDTALVLAAEEVDTTVTVGTVDDLTAALTTANNADTDTTIQLTTGLTLTETLVIDVGTATVTLDLNGCVLSGGTPVIRVQSGTLNVITTNTADEAYAMVQGSTIGVVVGANADQSVSASDCTLNVGSDVTLFATTAAQVVSGSIGGDGSCYGTLELSEGATIDATAGALGVLTVTLPAEALTVKLTELPAGSGVITVLEKTGTTANSTALVETLTVIVDEESNTTDYKLVTTDNGYAVTSAVDNTLPYQLTWLPVGDSITEGEQYMGHESSGDVGTRGGYRYQLWKTLDSDLGQDLRTVGFRNGHHNCTTCGVTETPDWAYHAALYGGDITGGNSGAQLFNVESTLEVAGYPDFISILIGINDLSRAGDNVDVTYESWTQLVDRYAKLRPNSKILAATLLPTSSTNGSSGAEVDDFNAKIRAAAEAETAPFDNSNVVLADIATLTGWGDGYDADAIGSNFKDGLHPNETGSQIVAAAFRQVIEANVLAPLKAAAPAVVHVDNATEGKLTVRFNKQIASLLDGTQLVLGGTDYAGTEISLPLTTYTIDKTDPRIVYFDLGETSLIGGEYTVTLIGQATDVTGVTSSGINVDTTGMIVDIYGSGAAENVPASFREGFIHRKTLAVAADANYNGETPTAAMTDGTGAATEVTNIGKVAYYVELQREGKAPQFVWVSMDATAFDYTEANASIPTTAVGSIKSLVSDLDVYGNRGNFEKSITGGQGVIEFSPYGCGGTDQDGFPAETHAGLTGWNDDLGDSGLFGIMQVARVRTESTGTAKYDPKAEMLFAFNGFNTDDGTDLAIGSMVVHLNNTGANATISYDWERFYERTQYPDFNPEVYTVKSVEVWVEPTTEYTTTWTGATDTAWETEGNWNNGVPKAMANAIIPVGTSITLNGAASAKSITIKGEEGTVTLTGAYALTVADEVALAEKQTLALTEGATLAATVTGAGTLSTTTLPGTIEGLTAETWSGNVELTNITVANLDLRLYGRDGSTITLNGVSGYWGYDNASTWPAIEIPANICIKGTNTNNNGYSSQQYDLTGKITGDGTLQQTTAGGGKYHFTGNMSGFTGTLKTEVSGGQIAIGTDTFTNGKITIGGTPTIACTLSATSGIVVETGATVTLSGTLDSATAIAAGATINLAADATAKAITITGEGEVATTGAHTLTVKEGITIAANQTLKTTNTKLAAPVSGAGTLHIVGTVYSGHEDDLKTVRPASITGLTENTWTGTVIFDTIAIKDLNLSHYGNANSTISLTGLTGSFDHNRASSNGVWGDWNDLEIPANICIDGAVNLTDGYTNQVYNFTGAITGEGTLKWTAAGVYCFTKGIRGFTGALTDEGGTSIVSIGQEIEFNSGLHGSMHIYGEQEINCTLKTTASADAKIVHVHDTAVINGTGTFASAVEFDGATVDATDAAKLLTIGTDVAASGTVNVALANDTLPANVFVSENLTVGSLDVGTVTINGVEETTKSYKFTVNGDNYQIDEAETVCKIGETPYESLAEAVEALTTGGMITLTDNITVDSTITINIGDGNTITMDLADKTISTTTITAIKVVSGSLKLITTGAAGMVLTYGDVNTIIVDGTATSTEPTLNIGENVTVTSQGEATVYVGTGTVGGLGQIVNGLALGTDATIDASLVPLMVDGNIYLPTPVEVAGELQEGRIYVVLPENTTGFPAQFIYCEGATAAGADSVTLLAKSEGDATWAFNDEVCLMTDNTTGAATGYGVMQYVCVCYGGKKYMSITDALRAGETSITLSEDTTENVTIPEGVTLNLAGNAVSGDLTIANGATLVTVGGTVEGDLILQDGATLNVSVEFGNSDIEFTVMGDVTFPNELTVEVDSTAATVNLGEPRQIIASGTPLTPGATHEFTTLTIKTGFNTSNPDTKIVATTNSYELVTTEEGGCSFDGVDYATIEDALAAYSTEGNKTIKLNTFTQLTETIVIDVGTGNTATLDLNGTAMTSTANPAIRIESGNLALVSDSAVTVSNAGTTILVGANADGTASGEASALYIGEGVTLSTQAATTTVNVVSGTIAGKGTISGNLTLAANTTVDATYGVLTATSVTFPGTDAENKAAINVIPTAGQAYPSQFIACTDAESDDVANTTVNVIVNGKVATDASFSINVKNDANYNATGYAVYGEDYTAIAVTDTTMTYFNDFANAATAAGSAGTVILLADLELTGNVETNIFSNGFNITVPTAHTLTGALTLMHGTVLSVTKTLTVSSLTVVDNAEVTINGAITANTAICGGIVSGTSTITGELNLTNGATIVNGASVTVSGEGNATTVNAGATVTIDGTLNTNLTVQEDSVINGAGTINIGAGTLAGAGTINPTVTLDAGATIDRTGTEDDVLELATLTLNLGETGKINVKADTLTTVLITTTAIKETDFTVTMGEGYEVYVDQTAQETNTIVLPVVATANGEYALGLTKMNLVLNGVNIGSELGVMLANYGYQNGFLEVKGIYNPDAFQLFSSLNLSGFTSGGYAIIDEESYDFGITDITVIDNSGTKYIVVTATVQAANGNARTVDYREATDVVLTDEDGNVVEDVTEIKTAETAETYGLTYTETTGVKVFVVPLPEATAETSESLKFNVKATNEVVVEEEVTE